MESLSSMRTVLTLFWQRASNDTLRSCFAQNCPLYHWGFWRRWKACADWFLSFFKLKEKLKRRNVFLSLLPRHFFLCSNPWIGLNFACVLLVFCLNFACVQFLCVLSAEFCLCTLLMYAVVLLTRHTPWLQNSPLHSQRKIFTKGDSRVNVFFTPFPLFFCTNGGLGSGAKSLRGN